MGQNAPSGDPNKRKKYLFESSGGGLHDRRDVRASGHALIRQTDAWVDWAMLDW